MVSARKQQSLTLKFLRITIENSKSVRSLDVTFDTNFNMSDHINLICCSSYYHLRRISNIRPYLSFDANERLIHAFISCHLNYCNSLLYALLKTETSKLQRIQNVAVCILTFTRRCDHIRPVVRSLVTGRCEDCF